VLNIPTDGMPDAKKIFRIIFDWTAHAAELETVAGESQPHHPKNLTVNNTGSNGETLEKGCPDEPNRDPKNENIQTAQDNMTDTQVPKALPNQCRPNRRFGARHNGKGPQRGPFLTKADGGPVRLLRALNRTEVEQFRQIPNLI
jgi:hypothetical protein